MKIAGVGVAVALVAVAGAVWYLRQTDDTSLTEAPEEIANEETAPSQPARVETEGQVETDVEGAVSEAEEALREAGDGAAAVLEDALGDIQDQATALGEDASAVVESTQEALSEAVSEALPEGGAAASAEAGASVSAEGAETGSETAAAFLTPEGFNYDKVIEMIDGSALDPLKKTAVKSAITQARDNPELLKVALEQARSALGF
ncbi:MAG: hypothetical protein BM562_00995 [Alphaproteobacteria bacterium MedPE-SWcel]|nr:MAG: hypothetical protein BM562_00995 [Alphaproteobacteria bacterium MedPE-SWcel]